MNLGERRYIRRLRTDLVYFVEGLPVELRHDHGQVARVVGLDVEAAALPGPLLFRKRRLAAAKVRGQSGTEPPSDSPRRYGLWGTGERKRAIFGVTGPATGEL